MNVATTAFDVLDREFLFGGLRPRWAAAAADRCVRRGFVRVNPDGSLELLPAGRAAAIATTGATTTAAPRRR
jgi:hypothetical protein